jgi:hypothetical protein
MNREDTYKKLTRKLRESNVKFAKKEEIGQKVLSQISEGRDTKKILLKSFYSWTEVKWLRWSISTAAVLFIVVQVLFYNINIFIIDGYGNDVGSEYDRDLTDIGDRVTNSGGSGGLQEGFFGTVLGVLFEIMPLFMGWLSVAFMRTKFLLKEDPKKIGNLVSGIKEVFTAIIKSFKTSE